MYNFLLLIKNKLPSWIYNPNGWRGMPYKCIHIELVSGNFHCCGDTPTAEEYIQYNNEEDGDLFGGEPIPVYELLNDNTLLFKGMTNDSKWEINND